MIYCQRYIIHDTMSIDKQKEDIVYGQTPPTGNRTITRSYYLASSEKNRPHYNNGKALLVQPDQNSFIRRTRCTIYSAQSLPRRFADQGGIGEMVYQSPLNMDEGDLYTGTRICRACNERLPMSEFYWAVKDKIRVRKCQKCCGERQRERKSERKDIYREQGFARSLRVKYGLTVHEWERLLQSQNEQCPICHKALSRKNTHVDHDHKTGKIRGLLCFECNTGIGKFHDDIDRLRAAISYLQSPLPDVKLRSRDLTSEELKQIRAKSAKTWHNSDVGRVQLKERSARFSGEDNAFARLTDSQVAEIIDRYQAGGISQSALALEFGVSQTNISRLVRGKSTRGKMLRPDASRPFKIDEEA